MNPNGHWTFTLPLAKINVGRLSREQNSFRTSGVVMASAKPSLYAYCVARLDMNEAWEVFPGLAERPVFVVRDQKVAMLVSRLEKVKLDDPHHVVEHGHVIHRVFERRTV